MRLPAAEHPRTPPPQPADASDATEPLAGCVSYATRLIALDSLGVTWLMMEVNTGERLCVIAVTRISGQYFCFVVEQGPNGTVARQRPLQVGELVARRGWRARNRLKMGRSDSRWKVRARPPTFRSATVFLLRPTLISSRWRCWIVCWRAPAT